MKTTDQRMYAGIGLTASIGESAPEVTRACQASTAFSMASCGAPNFAKTNQTISRAPKNIMIP